MSVTPVVKNGRAHWKVEVIRGGKRRRRYLDRKRSLRKDALEIERQLVAELEADGGEALQPAAEARATPVVADTTTAMEALDSAGCSPLQELRREETFARFTERYLAVQDHRSPDFKNKARNIRLHLIPFFGDTPLASVDRRMADELRVVLRTTPSRRGRRRPKTINNILGTLRAVLHLAWDYGLVERVPRIVKESDDKRDPEFLDFDEAEAVLESTPPEWRLLVWTALRTGLRRAELFELRWRDLQLDPSRRPHVRVRRALEYRADGSIAVKSTKSNQPRTVPLTGRLAAALLHERDRAQPRDRELVFPGEGGGYLVYKQVHRMLRQTAERAGVQKPARLHVLRHTFASHCYMRGVPPQVVQKWLGHSSVVMTERYAHLRPDAGDGLIDVLEETLAHASPKSVHL